MNFQKVSAQTVDEWNFLNTEFLHDKSILFLRTLAGAEKWRGRGVGEEMPTKWYQHRFIPSNSSRHLIIPEKLAAATFMYCLFLHFHSFYFGLLVSVFICVCTIRYDSFQYFCICCHHFSTINSATFQDPNRLRWIRVFIVIFVSIFISFQLLCRLGALIFFYRCALSLFDLLDVFSLFKFDRALTRTFTPNQAH